MSTDILFERRVPLTLVAALLLQASLAVWWAATKDADDHFQQQRVVTLEKNLGETKNQQAQIGERLARIEEKVNAEYLLLERIDKQINQGRKEWMAH